jgi:class 3 adenylate cyclase
VPESIPRQGYLVAVPQPFPTPLPDDPDLAAVAAAVRDTGQWGYVADAEWRLHYVSDEQRITFATKDGVPAEWMPGSHYFGPESVEMILRWPFSTDPMAVLEPMFRELGGWILADTPGGREALRGLVHPLLVPIVDELEPAESAAIGALTVAPSLRGTVDVPYMAVRIRRANGELAGTVITMKPAARMSTISAVVSLFDLDYFERMLSVSHPDRRPGAILMADLEGSSSLSKRLSSDAFFRLGRRLVLATDRCVVEAGGLVGRHIGDGVAAFFLTETFGSESLAARACVQAARTLRDVAGEVAERSGMSPDDLVVRFGLHWGSMMTVGNITTPGRMEVTALGDEVNEAARIEACASGGRILASKALIERLGPSEATSLAVDPAHATYQVLSELATATEKARRDAPFLSVCEL